MQCSQRDADINTIVMKKDDDRDSVIKLQEIKVHIVSPFKDGRIHFLKMKFVSVENALPSDSDMICRIHNKHETGTE